MTFKNQIFKDKGCCVCSTLFTPRNPVHKTCSYKCKLSHRAKLRRDNRAKGNMDKTTLKKWNDNNPKKRMLYSARSRAKKNNLDCNITESDIILPDVCPMLGIELYQSKGRTGHGYSLDRIDSDKGYIKGNVQVISDRANRYKDNMSLEDAELLVKFLRRIKDGSN